MAEYVLSDWMVATVEKLRKKVLKLFEEIEEIASHRRAEPSQELGSLLAGF